MKSPLGFLTGGGEMGQRIRSHPWAETSLGSPEHWPPGLRTALRVLLTTQHPMYIFWGPDRVGFYNDACARSMGPAKHPQALGTPGHRTWEDIWPIIGPRLEQVLRGDGATWQENQLVPIVRHGALEDAYWTGSYSPIDEPDAPNGIGGVLAICSETTQQVLTQRRLTGERERFAQLFEQAPTFMAVLRGPDHLFELANPGCLRLIGDRPVIGKTVAEAWPDAVEQGYLVLLDTVFQTGKPLTATGAKHSMRAIQGGPITERHLDFVYQPILDGDGKVSGIFVAGVDITSRALAETALREADRRKDEFLAMLAHELRNPLAPIRTAGEILTRTIPAESSTHAAAAVVKRQIVQLSRLVDDLLDVSRVSQGRIELQKETIEIAAVVDQAVETVAPLLREKNHELSIIPAYEPLYVYADVARLSQSVVNILTNAAKYTDAGGKIRISIRGSPDCVFVEICDNGTGISAELLPRVFEMFVQGDRTIKRSQGGLGIGLSVVRRLVEMHDGKITASSAGPDQGSTFELRFPRIASAEEAHPNRASPVISPQRVLVVDNDVDSADALAQLLSLDGHETEPAYSADAALRRVVSFAPDAVLLDIGLPDMDGYEVARRMRSMAQLENVNLIAITGFAQRGDREQARAAGFDEYLVKPVDFDLLTRSLRRLPKQPG